MLQLLRALLLRPNLERPWRSLVTVVGVGTGVAAVVATIAASSAAIAAFSTGVEEVAGRSRLEISRPGGVPVERLGDLRHVGRDALVVPVFEEITLLTELGDAVRLLGVDLLVDAQIRPVVGSSQEQLIEALTERACLLPEPLASQLDVSVGEEITISAQARPVALTVAAILDPPRSRSVWDRVVVVDIALAQELYDRMEHVDRIELTPREGVTVDQLEQALRPVLMPEEELVTPSRRRETAEEMVASLRFNLSALSAISVLVGGVLVATTLATSVVQRRYSIALARSLGASRGQIASVVLCEAVGLGLVGGVVGIIGGYLGARAALDSVRTTVAAVIQGVPSTSIVLEPWMIVGGMLLAVVSALTAAILPLAEAVATPPIQLLVHHPRPRLSRAGFLRATALTLGLAVGAWILTLLPAIQGLPIAALLAALCILLALLSAASPLVDVLARAGQRPLARLHWTPLRLAAAALAAGRRRAAWAAGAVAVATALAVAITTLVSSFRTTVEHWTEAGLRADIWVRPMTVSTGMPVGTLDPEIIDIATELFGAQAVDPFHTVPARFEGRPITLAGAAFDVVQHHGSVPFMDGRPSGSVFREALLAHGAVVNEPFANRFGVRRGDTIRLDVAGGPLEREVFGIFRDYSRSNGLVVIDRSDLLQRYPSSAPSEMALFFPAEVDAHAARQRLLDALDGRWLVEALVNRELRQEALSAFERTFAITGALAVVAGAVAVVAMITVLLALLAERARDLAVVRSVGGSQLQLAAVVLGQAMLLGVAAAAAGVVAGLLVGIILVTVVNVQSFGWSLELVVPWSSIGAAAMWVAAACLLAGILPAIRASRLQPAEVLRES